MLLFQNQTPIAQGRMRAVYVHPNDSSLLVKVIRPEVIDQRWGSGKPWYKAHRRFMQYISYMREIAEYVAMYARYDMSLPFAQKVCGLVETDMGLGLVTEALRTEAGEIAPSLGSLLRDHLVTDEVRGALEQFIEQVMTSEVIIADLHPGNIVYAHFPNGGSRFVMIDGLGLSNILPLKSVFPFLNLKSKRRHVARLRARMYE